MSDDGRSGPYYAIQRVRDGAFLPQASRKTRGHGYTHDEPGLDRPPRLFTRARDARVALTWWRKGVTSVWHTQPRGLFEYDDEGGEEWDLEPRADRVDEEMTIIQVYVVAEPKRR